MKTILAIETSTERCSVALLHRGQVTERAIEGAKRHAQSVLVFVDALLSDAGVAKTQLDAVAFGRGPGAFTGVRLAVAVAQGFAYALDIPALPVSTLAATAFDAFTIAPELQARPLLVALDARMGEVYAGRFAFQTTANSPGMVLALGEECVCKPDALNLQAGEACVGSGALCYAENFKPQLDINAVPRASAIALLSRSVQPVVAEHALPVYLRDHVALSIRERLAAGMPVMQPL
jgi:tRNA threonylcarbamoyladenosine biosynthesis protein TsaB